MCSSPGARSLLQYPTHDAGFRRTRLARQWLCGEQGFKGRSIDRRQLNLRCRLVERTANSPANLTIRKEGVGVFISASARSMHRQI